MAKTKNTLKKLLMNRVLFVIALFFVVMFTSAFHTEVNRRHGIKEEIRQLENEINSIDKKNKEMKEMIAYLKTSEFLEREARVKMGLAKENEQAIVFSELPAPVLLENSGINALSGDVSVHKSASWLVYFFGRDY